MKKNREFVILILFFLLVTVNLIAGDSGDNKNIGEIEKEDFRIYIGEDKFISMDMEHETVEEVLGKPLQVKVDKNPYDNNKDEIGYDYNDLKLYFYRKENKINYISVKANEYYSFRGIRVGDPISKVKANYNIEQIFPDGSLTLDYYTDDGTLRVFFIIFEVMDNLVSEIIFGVTTDL